MGDSCEPGKQAEPGVKSRPAFGVCFQVRRRPVRQAIVSVGPLLPVYRASFISSVAVGLSLPFVRCPSSSTN